MPLRALPVQMIELDDRVILKRGAIEVEITGDGVADVIGIIYASLAQRHMDEHDVLRQFAAEERPLVAELLNQLRSRRFITSNSEAADESAPTVDPLDTFYWHFNTTADAAKSLLAAKQIAIIGLNLVTGAIADSLADAGADNITVVDYSCLRNPYLSHKDLERLERSATVRRFEDWKDTVASSDTSCIIATADVGSQQMMREWNEFCVQSKRDFVPVVVEDLKAYIGPLVIPLKTPCYECFRARQNANMKAPAVRRLTEYVATDRAPVIGYHRAMIAAVGSIAAFEVIKAYTVPRSATIVGRVLLFNMLSGQFEYARILKIPRCAVCSSSQMIAPTSISIPNIDLS
jgi:thiazole/oxazole-forming peptide maturase SagC family component